MITYLCTVVVVALAAAWLLLLLSKWGVIEWLQIHGSNFVHKLASCYFCLSWWCCVVVTAVFISVNFVIFGVFHVEHLFIPILSNPLTRKLL